MRLAAPRDPPTALTIAGSDSGGGAGIQADLQAFTAQGVFGTSVVTAVTAQHTRGVESTHVLPTDEVAAQLSAVQDDFSIAAAKTGMLATREIVDLIADAAAGWSVPLVVDPVMVAASGDRLLTDSAEAAYERLIEHATLVTPNADEATALTGVEVTDTETARAAGAALLDMGADAALVKGGHLESDPVIDVLVTAEGAESFEHARVETAATHGSGCVLSATIAAGLANGHPVSAAVDYGTAVLERAIRYHTATGTGPGAVNPLVDTTTQATKPATATAVRQLRDRIVGAALRPLVPEVGMNVAGAVPTAETTADVAAIDGRIVRTADGVRAVGDVRFDASSHTAAVVLGAREQVPATRFGAGCRWTPAVEAGVRAHGWPQATVRSDGSIRDATATAISTETTTPVVFYDAGTDAEPICFLLAPDATTLGDRIDALQSEVTES